MFLVDEDLIKWRYTNGCCSGPGCGDCACCVGECHSHPDNWTPHISGDPQKMLRDFLRPVSDRYHITSILQMEPFNKHPAIIALVKKVTSCIKLRRNTFCPLDVADWNPYAPRHKTPWKTSREFPHWDKWRIAMCIRLNYDFKLITGAAGSGTVTYHNGHAGKFLVAMPVFFLARSNYLMDSVCDTQTEHTNWKLTSSFRDRRFPSDEHLRQPRWEWPCEAWLMSREYCCELFYRALERSDEKVSMKREEERQRILEAYHKRKREEEETRSTRRLRAEKKFPDYVLPHKIGYCDDRKCCNPPF